MPCLSVRYEPEDEWYGKVRVAVESTDFAGCASAWFAIGQLRDFCAGLEAFPIYPDAPASLEGGFWKEEGLDQVHVGLSVAPYDLVGGLVASVRLATPIWKSELKELHQHVLARFRTDYPSIDAFRQSLLGLIEGKVEVADLQGF